MFHNSWQELSALVVEPLTPPLSGYTDGLKMCRVQHDVPLPLGRRSAPLSWSLRAPPLPLSLPAPAPAAPPQVYDARARARARVRLINFREYLGKYLGSSRGAAGEQQGSRRGEQGSSRGVAGE